MANLVSSAVILFLSTLVISSVGKGPSHGRRVVCYMASWGFRLAGPGRFEIGSAGGAMPLCTHIVYLFTIMDATDFTMIPQDKNRDIDLGGYNQTAALKEKYPHVRVMFGFGGWVDSGNKPYSVMAQDPNKRAKFIESVKHMIKTYNFDGLDFNWQFPGDPDRGGQPGDKKNFVELIKELREAFDPAGFVLSVAVPAFPRRIDLGIDVKRIAEHAHFLNVLAYEYYTTWSGRVGPSAPLYSADNSFCINETVHRYLSMGAPSRKLNLGLSAYGTDFIMANPAAVGSVVGQVSTGHGFKGTFNDVDGFMAYNELCWESQSGAWAEKSWDDTSKTPFVRNGGRVVSFDNERSYTEKVKYAMELQFGGIIFYGLEKDDFNKLCTLSKEPYPMLTSIHRALLQYSKFNYNDIRDLCKKHLAKFFWNGMKS